MAEKEVARKIEFLSHRLNDAARLYEREAERCRSAISRAYLLSLFQKKQAQAHVFEKAVAGILGTHTDQATKAKRRPSMVKRYDTKLRDHSLSRIYDFATAASENDLDFFNALDSFSHSETLTELLSLLIDLERDFLFSVRMEYLEYLSREVAQEPVEVSSALGAMGR